MDGREFMRLLADELAQDLTQVDRLKKWTCNSDIIGAHAECAIRAFVARVVSPLRCLTGTIVWEDRSRPEHYCPQVDVMLVGTGPAPPIFEVSGFALVPRDGCFGILEIKRSNYPGACDAISGSFERIGEAFKNLDRADTNPPRRGLGVFCVEEKNRTKQETALVDSGNAVFLLKRSGNDLQVDHAGIWALTDFLLKIRESGVRSNHRPNIDLLRTGAQQRNANDRSVPSGTPQTNSPTIQ